MGDAARDQVAPVPAPPPSPPPIATHPAQSGSLDRLQRLVRMEQERLELEARREERRLQAVVDAKPTGGRHDLVDRIEAVTKYPLLAIGIAWLVLGIVAVTDDAHGSASTVLVTAVFALWIVLLAEYVVRLVVTPDRVDYVKRRWVEPATVLIPPLQGWHVVGIEKMGILLHEGELRIEGILRHHSLFRVLIAAVGTVFVGAWAVLLFEENTKGTIIRDYPNALWWAVVTVTTVGYGDYYPKTEGGRAVATVLMLVGIGLIGVLTATVASVFIKEHTDANKEAFKQGHDELGHRLEVISDRLGDVERRLGASNEDIAAVDGAADDVDPAGQREGGTA